MTLKRVLLCGAALAAFGVADIAPALAQIEEILVTARKREESLQTVPVAVTAFTGTDLKQLAVVSTAQLDKFVPNMFLTHNNVGLNITIRGLSLSEGLIGEDPAVAVYMDGVYLARPNASVLSFVDVEAVEVLRGPQGTLFGRNTTGGAIHIKTKRPIHEFETMLNVRAGNYDRLNVAGVINVPLVPDVLAVRMAVQSQYQGGFGRNLINGQTVGGDEERMFFGSLLWEPMDNVEVVIRGDYRDEHEDYVESPSLVSTTGTTLVSGLTYFGATFVEAGLTPAAVCALYCRDPNNLPWDTVEEDFSGLDGKHYGLSATITVDLLDNLTAKAIVNKRWLRRSLFFDLDGTPLNILTTNQVLEHQQFAGEFQLFGDNEVLGRNLEWIAGAFYFDEQGLQGSPSQVLPFLSPLAPRMIRANGNNKSTAGFAEINWEVLDDVRFTAGGRYTSDDKMMVQLSSQGAFATEALATAFSGGAPVLSFPKGWTDLFPPNSPAWQGSIGAVPPGMPLNTVVPGAFAVCAIPAAELDVPTECRATYQKTFNSWAWNFGFDWSAWEEGANSLLLYAKYTRGFRSGGFNTRGASGAETAYDPEVVRQEEAGFKLDMLDGNLRLNAAGFHQKIKDKVVVTVISGAGGLTTLLSNAATATVYGAEGEAVLNPLPELVPGLQLRGTVGWKEARYDSFPDLQPLNPALPVGPGNPIVSVDRSGEPYGGPHLSTSLSAIYTTPLPNWDAEFMARIDWAWKDSISLSRFASTFDETGDFSEINARMAVRLMASDLELSVWCANCTDMHRLDQVLDLRDSLGYAVAERNHPRTFGGEITWHYGG